jgi:hydroxyacylglutathione hydrolase
MASAAVLAKRYFSALQARDLDAALACWRAGASQRIAGRLTLEAPDGLQAHFTELFGAFPDLRLELIDTTTQRERCSLRWRASGTFAGPGRFHGLAPNGAVIAIEGCDVLEVAEDQIVAATTYVDGGALARQLALLPAAGPGAAGLPAGLVNARTALDRALRGAEPEAVAAGVWVLRGGLAREMNVFLIEEAGGVTVFDSGPRAMSGAIRAVAARFGGVARVVLSHADCDHRGGAAGLGAEVHCHARERAGAQSPSPYRDYWNLGLLGAWRRPVYERLLARWDGGALTVTGTLAEDDAVAGFRVLQLPGHAPGLIALHREEDGLALVSDALCTVDPRTALPCAPRLPHAAFNLDIDLARESLCRLAALAPTVVWPGHGRPLSGAGVRTQLERLAAADG